MLYYTKLVAPFLLAFTAENAMSMDEREERFLCLIVEYFSPYDVAHACGYLVYRFFNEGGTKSEQARQLIDLLREYGKFNDDLFLYLFDVAGDTLLREENRRGPENTRSGNLHLQEVVLEVAELWGIDPSSFLTCSARNKMKRRKRVTQSGLEIEAATTAPTHLGRGSGRRILL